VYFIWVNKVSYLTYAFAGVVGSEFQGLTLTDPTTGEVADRHRVFVHQGPAF
jgi:hypothetical protein